jgi:hypothetical protein
MDADNRGLVEYAQFHKFAERRFRWQLSEKKRSRKEEELPTLLQRAPAEDLAKFVSRLSDVVAHELFGTKACASLARLLKLLWMRATQQDVSTMKTWCREVGKEPGMQKVPAPPVLSSKEYEELCSMFQHFDKKQNGKLYFEDLVEVGVVYPDEVERTREDWDRDNNGFLAMPQFCEMMCPVGFRATASSLVGHLSNGKRVLFDGGIGGWRTDERKEEGRSIDNSFLRQLT